MGRRRERNREAIEQYLFARSLAHKRFASGDIPDEGAAGKTRREGSPPMSISYLDSQMASHRARAFTMLKYITEVRLPAEAEPLSAVCEAVIEDWRLVRSWKAGKNASDRRSLALYNRLLFEIESMLPEGTRLPKMGPSPSGEDDPQLIRELDDCETRRKKVEKMFTLYRRRLRDDGKAIARTSAESGYSESQVRRIVAHLR